MKVVKYYEFDLENQDEMLKKWAEYLEKSKKNPEKYPKYIAGPFIVAESGEYQKGISIMEIENDAQLVNYILDLSPPLKAKFEYVYDAATYIPLYLARKQEK